MPEITIRLPHPHRNQTPIINHPARFKVLACGRRFGKTEVALIVLCIRALSGQQVAYFAPTFKMSSQFWRQVVGHMKPAITRANRNDGRIEFAGGGSLDFWSLSTSSAETVRGRKYHYIVVDEAAMVIQGQMIWGEVMRPMLMDWSGGAMFLSTPRGRNWFHELFMRGLDPLQPEYAAWRYKSTDNPYIAESEVEGARLTTPERSFNQEYLAEFLEDAGMVFRGVQAISTAQPQEALPGRRYWGGIDWGRHNDFSVISIFDKETRTQVYIDRFNQIGWEAQRSRVKLAAERYPGVVFFGEVNSIGEVNMEALEKDGLDVRPFVTSSRTKTPLIEGLQLAIERQEVTLLDDEIQIFEFQSYGMERVGNRYVYGPASGGHDDTVMATAIAWYGVEHGAGMETTMLEVPVVW
jgi:hypothetical protein